MEDYSQYNGEGTTLRKMQLRILDILVEVDRVCRKHNITYWLDWGTLLGAVRHGGFIPWDDDIDIAMLSEDLARFKEIAPKELNKSFFLQTKETDPSYRLPFCKIRDLNSFYVTKHEDFTRDYHKGLFIDIFEIVPYPNVNKKLTRFIMHWYQKINFFFCIKNDISLKNHLATIIFPIMKLGLDVIWSILNLGRKNRLGLEKHFTSGKTYTREMIFPIKDIVFEGKVFMGPSRPDLCLTEEYGDYMQLPPKEKRKVHLIHIEFDLAE
jgi:lipopolysaccharide cholinephosphotransferase